MEAENSTSWKRNFSLLFLMTCPVDIAVFARLDFYHVKKMS
jgi:hypothetical protein